MKKILFAILLTCSFVAEAQVYNNEWIDYNKTYYKFKLGKDGLYRIPQTLLATAGLDNVPAEQFQLWRNGVQVPIYTTIVTGVFSSTDYIEFWGRMNDGKPDRELYRQAAYHLNDKWSLSTDTASYFLTVNPVIGENLRLLTAPNNTIGNVLPAEPYFMHTLGQYFKNRINYGYAVNVGENLYSSSYDRGEGYASTDIISTFPVGLPPVIGANTINFPNLFVYPSGPDAKFKIATSGNALNQRRYKVTINGDSIIGKSVDFFNYTLDSTTFPLSVIGTNAANVSVSNITNCTSCPSSDRMVVHKYEITYPRVFNFGNTTNFEFSLPASASGNYLEIANFNFGTSTPVLYDLTTHRRYVADKSAAPLLKFVLPPSTTARQFVLVSMATANISTVSSLTQRNFVDLTSPAYHGDYLIISNALLQNGAGGTDPIEEYRAYRSSATGGSYNAKIFLDHELEDQFGFGIKKWPGAIRNFIRYARNEFSVSPKFVFIIGKGVHYVNNRAQEAGAQAAKENLAKLNLVPTFGWPASDVLLSAEPGSSQPLTPIGRLSAITPEEVKLYLEKVKEFELAQTMSSPLIDDKGWMKNAVHIVGASEGVLSSILDQAMDNFRKIIIDTLFGARVTTFSKSSSDALQQLTNQHLTNLFNEGISLMTYFGHSSASTLEFNLDDPENYNNQGKYPLFIALGCNAGSFFNYNTLRFVSKETISEKYVLAPNRGTIGFIASTHFGIVHYLDIWNTRFYKRLANTSYGKSIGELMMKTAEDVFAMTTQEDFYARSNTEETQFHGDPALVLNPHPKPDYAVEAPMVRISPGFISVADQLFNLQARFENLGRAINKPVVIEVKREFPDQSVEVIIRDTIPGIRSADSVNYTIAIDPINDKGLNKIIVTIDPENEIDELYETNNSVTRDLMIYEDEARPVFPYNYAIVNQQNPKLIASTANPFAESKTYRMELDTTELFNSPMKIVRTISSMGGTMEFDPNLVMTDSTVYYWRVSPDASNGLYSWNKSSFVYLPNSSIGFNQSHLYQHLKSELNKITLDSTSRYWDFGTTSTNLFVRNGVFPSAASHAVDISISVNGDPFIRSVCGVGNIIFNVFDKRSMKPWKNAAVGEPPLFGSDPVCGPERVYNFQYNLMDSAKRRKAVEFLEMIPEGNFVVVRNTSGTAVSSNTYANQWQDDTTYFGSGRSLYHLLKQQGFADVDSFDRPEAFIFIYQKDNAQEFDPKWIFSQSIYEKITLGADCASKDTVGYITSPLLGPAKAWHQLKWDGEVESTPGDHPSIAVIGINTNGTADTLFSNIGLSQKLVDISGINAQQYPFIKLRMINSDSVHYSPLQLKYWRVTYDPVPEGAISPGIYFSMKDTVEVAEPLLFKLAFKNISGAAFSDSIKVKAVITDRNNVEHILPAWRQRSLPANDTLHIRFPFDTRSLVGNNTFYVEVNPDNDQPEQYHFNNFFYQNFFVRGDTVNPVLDVTFDNVRILNGDIVSGKPNIMIRLKDEAKWFLIDDTSAVKVQVRFPDNSLHNYYFDGVNMVFVPASQSISTGNSASVILTPEFDQDGEYELMVTARDMSQNKAGPDMYRVNFQVINKAMISNMMNYPNPFTTSTAFVFTLTGSEVPQNIRIQIMTVTGKIVREILKEELGPIHIGRNITEFKWDGTDQYGQKLANGVYLYRVITNLNGKGLEKYRSTDDNTDKYFNKGYGKMYLMR